MSENTPRQTSGNAGSLGLNQLVYLLLDAYYGSRKMVLGLLTMKNHLDTRMKSNSVAYWKPVENRNMRGRPQIYGE